MLPLFTCTEVADVFVKGLHDLSTAVSPWVICFLSDVQGKSKDMYIRLHGGACKACVQIFSKHASSTKLPLVRPTLYCSALIKVEVTCPHRYLHPIPPEP